MNISRTTRGQQSIQTSSGRTYIIPDKAQVYVNNIALQTDPAVWGEDAQEFRPSRWIVSDPANPSIESLFVPPKNTFNPWSGGPRVCIGVKTSQVEFVASIMTVLRQCTIVPIIDTANGEETVEYARKRIIDVIADSQPRVTLQMNRPQDLKIKFERR